MRGNKCKKSFMRILSTSAQQGGSGSLFYNRKFHFIIYIYKGNSLVAIYIQVLYVFVQ